MACAAPPCTAARSSARCRPEAGKAMAVAGMVKAGGAEQKEEEEEKEEGRVTVEEGGVMAVVNTRWACRAWAAVAAGSARAAVASNE